MLSSEFSQEIGALVRRLESRVRTEPSLQHQTVLSAQESIERAIVVLCSEWLELEREAWRDR